MVLAFIASEKFAKTLVLRATPGVPSGGLVERTVGEVVSGGSGLSESSVADGQPGSPLVPPKSILPSESLSSPSEHWGGGGVLSSTSSGELRGAVRGNAGGDGGHDLPSDERVPRWSRRQACLGMRPADCSRLCSQLG
jgi:hypothetical protein